MKKIFLIVLLIFSLTSCGQTNDEAAEVRKAFDSFKKAVAEGNGPEALKWLDRKSRAYYDTLIFSIIYEDSVELQKRKLLERFIVLTFRQVESKNELLSLDGEKLFIFSIKKGIIADKSMTDLTIEEVAVEGNFAKARYISEGEKSPFYLKFIKEEGQWKFDMTSFFEFPDSRYKQLIERKKWTETEFIYQALSVMSGKPVYHEIWKPLK